MYFYTLHGAVYGRYSGARSDGAERGKQPNFIFEFKPQVSRPNP